MKNRVLLILSALSVIIAAAGISILPDNVPAHFGLNGDADRIGSKYEVLLFAAVVTAVTAAGILIRRRFEKAGNGGCGAKESAHAASNAKMIGTVCAAVNTVMLGIEVVFICIGYSGITQISGTEGELYCSATAILMGLLFTVLGNIMPKMKMNGLMGLRTKWSMKNEEVWARSQRMCGTVTFFGGVAIILAGIILRGYPSLVAMMIICLIIFAITIKGSHQICTDWEKEKENE